jgi:hypothetical protein
MRRRKSQSTTSCTNASTKRRDDKCDDADTILCCSNFTGAVTSSSYVLSLSVSLSLSQEVTVCVISLLNVGRLPTCSLSRLNQQSTKHHPPVVVVVT